MSEPTIGDLFTALGGDPAVTDPTIDELVTAATAAGSPEAADVPFDNSVAKLPGAPDNLQDALEAAAVEALVK